MSKTVDSEPTDDLQPEYDFSTLKDPVRGKYAQRYAEGTNLVLLAPDVAEVFADEAAVNEALRLLIRLARTEVRTSSGSRKVGG